MRVSSGRDAFCFLPRILETFVTALPSDALMPDSFAEFGLSPKLLDALTASGIGRPFPIQAATLPDALAGRDILGRAKTGSGKTLGFSLPLVEGLASSGARTRPGRPRGLVLVPTRELASQVERVLRPLAEALGLAVTTVFGGVPMRGQIMAMRRATDIVVACPGRLADLIERGHCDLGDVEITVLDEADQMADLGFLPIVRRLLDSTPSSGQRLLFSATLDSAIDVLARRFLTDPARHSVDETAPPATMTHHLLTVAPADRLGVLVRLAGGENRSLIFTRTKHGAKRLAKQLTTAGIPAAQLHGDLTQNARARNLAAFTNGEVRVLAATDIAARGIHVDGIDLVIHADPPAEHKAYLHRSGRTARGGADGTVVTVQLPAQSGEVKRLMRKAGVTPVAATVTPVSTELATIAGPEAPRSSFAPRAEEPAPQRASRSPRPPRGDANRRPRRENAGQRPASRDQQGGNYRAQSGSRRPHEDSRGSYHSSGSHDAPRGDSRGGWASEGRAADNRGTSGRGTGSRSADGKTAGGRGRQARSGRPAAAGRSRGTEFRGRGA
jgi:superfamily II DNA/RNA helicase